MVPKTSDGRVLFAVPWLGKTILGTTDTPRHDLDREPTPFREEVDFILREAGRYLSKAPTRADVRSVWVGLRPLVKPPDDEGDNTKALSREHTVHRRALGPGHGDRRQVDHLPRHGRGRARPLHGQRRAAAHAPAA